MTPLVYGELRNVAQQVFRRESPGHTLQPTALAHEAYLRLIGVDIDWNNRAHFFALAARMMRRMLVNHAKQRNAHKRGGGVLKVTFNDAVMGADNNADEVLELDRALSALAEFDERKARLLELHYFAGLTHEQAAASLGVSEPTSRRDLRLAKAWLRKYLTEQQKIKNSS